MIFQILVIVCLLALFFYYHRRCSELELDVQYLQGVAKYLLADKVYPEEMDKGDEE